MSKLHTGILLTGFFFTTLSVAHDDAYLDSHPTPHGGQVRMAGPYHLEALTDQGRLLIYVTDHGGTPIPTGNWKGQATVLAGSQKHRYALEPAGNNTLRSNETVATATDTVMVLSVTPAAGAPELARYNRLSARVAQSGK